MIRLVRRTSPTRKRAWLSVSTTSIVSALASAGQARDLGQGARRDDRLAHVLGRRLERGAAHRQAVGVGRHHRDALGRDAQQHAGQHRAGLVAGRRPGHAVDRLDQGLGGQREARALVGGQLREVVRLEAVQRERGAAAGDLDDALVGAVLEGHRPVGHAPDDVAGEPGQHDRARLLGGGRQGHPQRQLHVGGGELAATVLGPQEDVGEDLDGALGRRDAAGHGQLAGELLLRVRPGAPGDPSDCARTVAGRSPPQAPGTVLKRKRYGVQGHRGRRAWGDGGDPRSRLHTGGKRPVGTRGTDDPSGAPSLHGRPQGAARRGRSPGDRVERRRPPSPGSSTGIRSAGGR